MPPPYGIFVLADLTGEGAAQVRALMEHHDPKLARRGPPHVTLVGSSGVGPIPSDTPVEQVRAALAPIAATTPPLVLPMGAPHRFMQTDIVSLPLDPHGALRTLHERLARSGLPFVRSRFFFTPHVTLSFYPQLTAARARALLAARVTAPAELRSLRVVLTRDPQPDVALFTLPLSGGVPAAGAGGAG